VVVPDSSRDHHWRHDNTTARTVAFGEGEVVNRDALLVMIRQVISDNQAVRAQDQDRGSAYGVIWPPRLPIAPPSRLVEPALSTAWRVASGRPFRIDRTQLSVGGLFLEQEASGPHDLHRRY